MTEPDTLQDVSEEFAPHSVGEKAPVEDGGGLRLHPDADLMVALHDYAQAADREATTARAARDRLVCALYEAGALPHEIAGALGITRYRVHGIIRSTP